MNLDTRLLVIGQSVMDYLCTENKTINEQYGIEAFSMNKKEIKILNKLLEVAEITSQSVGGCATNTSFGLNNLGFKHTYLGTVGDDEDGSYFIKEFNKLKFVNSQITQQVDGKTGKILTFFGKTDNSNQRTNAYNYGVANDLQIPKNFFNFAYFSLFSLLEDPSNKVFNLLQDLHKKGTKIMVDGGGLGCLEKELLGELFKFISGIFINKKEEEFLKKKYSFSLEKLSEKSFVVVKNGNLPTEFYNEGKKEFSVYVNSSDLIVNSMGAGDAFAAAFIAEYFKSQNFYYAVKSGNTYAKRIVSKNKSH